MHISSDHICALITLSIPAPGYCGSLYLSQLNPIFLLCLSAYVSVIRFTYRRMGEGLCMGAQASNIYTPGETVFPSYHRERVWLHRPVLQDCVCTALNCSVDHV